MPLLFPCLVEQLISRTGGKGKGANAEEKAGQFFLIACDLLMAFRTEDLVQHLEEMLAFLHAATEGVNSAPSPSPALVAGSAAILCYFSTQRRSAANETHCSVPDVAASLVAWQEDMQCLLAAHPPLSDDVQAAAFSSVAHLLLQGQCDDFFRVACAALANDGHCDGGKATGRVASSTIAAATALEVLAHCASLMVQCHPFLLSGVPLKSPADGSSSATSFSRSSAVDAKSTNTQRRGRAKPNTQRHTPSPSEKAPTPHGAAVEAVKESEGKDAGSVVPSCFDVPALVRITALQEQMIQSCLAALGADQDLLECTASNSAVPMRGGEFATRQLARQVSPALLCQRLLIPLLLLNGGKGLDKYEARIHGLLRALAGATNVPRSLGGHEVPFGGHAALTDAVACANYDEVVLLMAALFEYLFCKNATIDLTSDFRRSPLLWNVLRHALRYSLTALHLDAGHRANMQLRVEYLLKRIVYMTREQQQQLCDQVPSSGSGNVVVIPFHPLFQWCASSDASAVAWDQFFLVLESLHDYGWHIIQPIMPRLDALVAQLDAHLTQSTPSVEGVLHPEWVEMLLLKLILHPNLGIRKVGLRRVWGLPTAVLRVFSAEFLFTYVFQSAADPRLCSDIDRMPITATFLDTKAFEGEEVKAVPDVEPLAQEVENFYRRLFVHRWAAANASAAAAERVDALCRLLDNSLCRPPRFTVCVAVRTLHGVAQALREAHVPTSELLLNDGIMQRLLVFLRDSVQENVPFWLDIRVTALMFATLTQLASDDPRRCRQHPLFWRLYCLCGPLGESGGRSVAGMDACGQFGQCGSSIDERFLQEWLQLYSRRVAAEPHDTDKVSSATPWSFLEALLDVDALPRNIQSLMHPSLSSPPAAGAEVDIAAAKEQFFLLGTLCRTLEQQHQDIIAEIGGELATSVASFHSRAYPSATVMLQVLACFVEFHRSTGSETCSRLFSTSTLEAISAAVHEQALHVLQEAIQRSSKPGSDLDESAAVWTFLQTTNWDIMTAAVASIQHISLQHWRTLATGTSGFEGSSAFVARIIQLIEETSQSCSVLQQQLADNSVAPHHAEMEQKRAATLLLLCRAASRLLQSEVCSLLSFTPTCSDARVGIDGRGDNNSISPPNCAVSMAPHASLPPPPLPNGRESVQTACHLLPFSSAEAAVYAKQLMTVAKLKTPTISVPSHLSLMTWSVILGQQNRYLYNALYVLLLCVDAASQPAVVRQVESFGLQQLDECWTANLACVYDLLMWVASTGLEGLHYTAIAEGMWDHMREVEAKQYTRLFTMAFQVLHYVMPHEPEYVREVLLRVLQTDTKEAQTNDRDVYLASVTASLQVLRDEAQGWPVLLDVLVQSTVLFNTNRDEEENEANVAVTEPLLWSWPEELRMYYPPTTRMSSVGRAMAIATLLWCCSKDRNRAVELSWRLLRMNSEDAIVLHEPCMPNSRTHRVRIRLWQLLCALQPHLLENVSAGEAHDLFQELVMKCLQRNNLGSVRRLMELYAIRFMERHTELYVVIGEALSDYSLRPQVCGSYILIACYALLHLDTTLQRVDLANPEGAFECLFPRLLQQSTSNQHLLRIISHIGLHKICALYQERGYVFPSAIAAINDYISNAPEHVKFREKHEYMLFFDTAEASAPRSLFCVQRKEANTVLTESIPAAAFERFRFLETEICCMIGALYPIEQLRVRQLCATLDTPKLLQVFQTLDSIPHTSSRADYYVDYTREATTILVRDPLYADEARGASPDAASENAAATNVQKKVSSWWTSQIYNELHPRALGTQKQSIIVVASLLENPVNIAGLCRCGEIFAVEQITVPERRVFEHPHFVAAARSAELWIPWKEVAPRDLPAYLEELRCRGYVTVGVEQTANSQSMEKFAFPERCAVVLGSEGQGIPAPLIPLLDICVEIPQYGLIRSLNVHVTGAIAMFEYTRQHLMTK